MPENLVMNPPRSFSPTCRGCGSTNTTRALFCQQCGISLAAAPLDDAGTAPREAPQPDASTEHDRLQARLRDRAGQLVLAAEAARESGQLSEAEKLCHEALTLDRESTSAHRLLAGLFEERGDLEAAAREVQELVRLNPNSQLNRLWYTRLRRHLNVPRTQTVPRPLLWVLATGLILSWFGIGYAVVRWSLTSPPAPSPRVVSSPGVRAAPPDSGVPEKISASPFRPVGSQAAAVPVPSAGGVSNVGASDADAVVSPNALPRSPSVATPAPTVYSPRPGRQFGSRSRFDQYAPADSVPILPATVPRRMPPADSPAPVGPSIRIIPQSGPPAASSFAPGSGSGSSSSAAPAPAPPAAGFPDLMARAQTLYAGGDYGRAISQYRKALDAAPTVLDAARAHQQIGMAYSGMGAPRAAQDEYRQAESLYSSLLSGTDAEVARQAIQTLHRQEQLLDSGG